MIFILKNLKFWKYVDGTITKPTLLSVKKKTIIKTK